MSEAAHTRDLFTPPDDGDRESPTLPDDELLLRIIRRARLTLWAADHADENFAIRLWNSGAERIYGYSSAEALGRNYLDLFVNPAERAKAINDQELVLHHGHEFKWNVAAADMSRDGTIRNILANCFRVWDAKRGRYLIAEVGIDLSDLERAAEEVDRVLGLSQLQLDARTQLHVLNAFSAINAAVAKLADPDGRGLARVVQATGEAVESMFAGPSKSRLWLVDDAETARLADGSHDLPAPPAMNEPGLVDAVVQGRQSVFVDLSDVHGRGSSYAAVPLLFGAEVVGTLIVLFPEPRNLSEGDRLMLQHFGTHIAVAVRMATLANEMQRRRREDTERTRLAIMESVLHTVGNESGRVRLAIDSLAEALAGTDLDDQVDSSLNVIKSAAGRLGQIMGELMRLGEQVHNPVQLRLAETVRIVTRPVERDHYRTIQIDHFIEPELCVLASEYLLREVVANLVNNAVQAMTEADGGGDLRISATPTALDARPQVQLDIEDSGPGVAPQHRTAIWTYGFTTRGEGHGHGLAQTRGLVSMLGGSVDLVPQPSTLGGAHFRLMLPVAPIPFREGRPQGH